MKHAIPCFVALLAATSSARAQDASSPQGLPLASVQSALEGIRIQGFAQLDYLRLQRSSDQLSDGSGSPLNENRFTIRRARIRLDKHWTHVGVTSITELVAGDSLQQVGFEAFASLKPLSKQNLSPLQFRVGLFPVPFGFESYDEPAPNRFFGERTLFVSSFVPGRFDIGAALSGRYDHLQWILALQNGEPNGSPYAYSDPNDAKDVIGRIQMHASPFDDTTLSFASSFLVGKGFSAGSPPTKDSFEWRDLNEDGRVLPSELTPIPGSSARPSQNFRRWGLGADVQLRSAIPHLGKSFIYGEAAFGVNLDRGVAPADPILLGRDQRGFGYYLAWVQELTKHATLGVRYEHYEPNKDDLELAGGLTVVTSRQFKTLTTGLAFNRSIATNAVARVLAEYEYQDNDLGRDASGRPANVDNNTFRLRFEIRFR